MPWPGGSPARGRARSVGRGGGGGNDRDGRRTPRPATRGPSSSTRGPLAGPILRGDDPPRGVVASPDEPRPVGIGSSAGRVAHRTGPAATPRPAVNEVEPDGRYPCVGREPVRLGDAVRGVRGRDGEVRARPIEAGP